MVGRLKVIVGLGNPGPDYEGTRHNIGFEIIEEIAGDAGISLKEKKFEGGKVLCGKGAVGGQELLLTLPQTFMNLSGGVVRQVLDYYRWLPETMLVVHDDIDLPFGSLKWGYDSGSAGHRGVQSVIEALGSSAFHRLRFGVGRPNGDVVGYVLSRFSKEEKVRLNDLKKESVKLIEKFIKESNDA
ncbi:MAG: aminoacyl-tRNA hydrolase [Deltaproteobacteria bacterium]|nr:aminoacyl-tRNA hydrolase [Deltaproteobacteria bacterium]